MPLPTFHVSISGSVLAAYAAVVSSITGTVQVFNYFRDRAHLIIRVQHNMEMMGDPRYEGMSLIIMNVVNAGRRPITVTGVGAYRLFPHNPFVLTDERPRCPCELTEGKQLTAYINQEDLDLSVMESWEASTSAGKTYRLAVVPWYSRWWNRRKFLRNAIAEGKKKKKATSAEK
jgi:hypothetical protein